MLTRATILLITTCLTALAQWGVPDEAIVARSQTPKFLSPEAIAVDSDGMLHALWVEECDDLGARHVLHSSRSPGQLWLLPDTVLGCGTGATGAAVASNDEAGELRAAIATHNGIWTYIWLGDHWSLMGGSLFGIDAYSVSLAVDHEGTAHLATIKYVAQQDSYFVGYGNSLGHEIVIEESDIGIAGFNATPSIAVESDGTVHIAYCGGTLEEYHAHDLSAAPPYDDWQDQVVAAENQADFSADVAILPNGCVEWCISGNSGLWTPDRVFFCACGEGCQEVAFAHDRGAADAVFAVDQLDYPHFISSETDSLGFTGMLLASDWDWDYWRTEPIFGPGASSPSLVIDDQGYGHVLCLRHETTGDIAIYHLTSEFPLWLDTDPARPEIPHEIQLSVFPNPFNPTTEIRFDLPRQSQITLSVFDLSGRLVATLADRSLEAGSHRIRFDAGGLTSGVYFCHLQGAGPGQTAKLLLLR